MLVRYRRSGRLVGATGVIALSFVAGIGLVNAVTSDEPATPRVTRSGVDRTLDIQTRCEAFVGDDKPVKVYDQGTKEVVEVRPSEFCPQALQAETRPDSDIQATYSLRNGELNVEYHRVTVEVTYDEAGVAHENHVLAPEVLAPDDPSVLAAKAH